MTKTTYIVLKTNGFDTLGEIYRTRRFGYAKAFAKAISAMMMDTDIEFHNLVDWSVKVCERTDDGVEVARTFTIPDFLVDYIPEPVDD